MFLRMKKLALILIVLLSYGNSKAQTDKARGLYLTALEKHKLIGEYEAAIKMLDLSIKEDRTYAAAYEARGECYFKLKNYDLAVKDFKSAISFDKNKLVMPNAYYYLGKISEIKGLQSEADAYFVKVYESSTSRGEYYAKSEIEIAHELWNQGDKNADKVIQLCKNAILLNPAAENYVTNLAMYQKSYGKLDDALKTYERLLKFKHSYVVDHSQIYFDIAEIYDKKALDGAADQYYVKAISYGNLMPTQISRHFLQSYSKIASEKREWYLQRWNKLMPTEFVAKITLGEYYLKAGDYKNSIKYFDEAIVMNNTYPLVLRYRAIAYGEYGNQLNKIEYFHKALNDMNTAITQKDGNTAENYYTRGHIRQRIFFDKYDTTKKVDEEMGRAIIEDVKSLLAINEKVADVYRLRAEVNYLLNGEKETADMKEDMALFEKYSNKK